MPFPPFWLLHDVTTDSRRDLLAQGLSGFVGRIKEEPVVRIMVDGTPGYGHQSGSVLLLRRLCEDPGGPWQGYGYDGIVEVCYQTIDKPVLPKLQMLLPELKGKVEGEVGAALVKLVDLDVTKLTTDVLWGLCGGFDLPYGINLNEDLRARNVLVLQPFNYAALEKRGTSAGNILRVAPPAKYQDAKVFDFGIEAPAKPFAMAARAYYVHVPDLTAEDWTYYTTQPFSLAQRKLTQWVRYLITDPVVGTVSFTMLYGVNYPGECAFAKPVADRLVVEVATLRRVAEAAGILPPVVVNFGDYQPGSDALASYSTLRRILGGGPTAAEQAAGAESLDAVYPPGAVATAKQAAWRNRKAQLPDAEDPWYKFVDVAGTDATTAELVQWLKGAPGRVLFLQLGFVPPPVFGLALRNAALPVVFEGTNTQSVALNVGKPYLATNVPGDPQVRYPSGTVGSENFAPVAVELQRIANQVNADVEAWPPNPAAAPPAVLATFMVDSLVPDNKYRKYFGSVAEFYAKPENDKFNIGAALAYRRVTSTLAAAAAEVNPLEELYQRVLAAADAGKGVDLLVDAFPSGDVHDFYAALAAGAGGGDLLVTAPRVSRTPETGPVESVTLTGATTGLGVPTTVHLDVTAPWAAIESRGRFTGNLPWGLDGAPWMVFDQPFAEVLAADGMPPTTYVGGRIRGADVEVSAALPVELDRIVVRGEVTELASISRFFALAGGADLLGALPAPLQGLAGIGVRGVEIGYDATHGSVDSVTVRVETASPWNFFDRLTLDDIRADVTVTEPAGARTVRMDLSGTIRLGKDAAGPLLHVSATAPDVVLRGALASPALPLGDLIDVFWPGARPDWPGGHEPAITDLTFGYTVAGGAYSLLVGLDLSWPVTIAGTDIVTIEHLTLQLDRAGGAATGSLVASVEVLPGTEYAVGMVLGAAYLGAGAGWRFDARQVSGVVPLGTLLRTYLGWPDTLALDVDGLELVVETATSSFEFQAKTAGAWHIPIDTGIDVVGAVRLGYDGRPGQGWFGAVSAEIRWRGIDLTVFYDYHPDYASYGIVWGPLTGKIEKTAAGSDVATVRFEQGTTLGSLVETMVSWATGTKFSLGPPWDLLDDIPLGNVSLVYDFTAGSVSFDVAIGPIELGFARIEGIALEYASGVQVTLLGEFRWQEDPGRPLSWDATKPETTPAPPAHGNEYFDLRLLALGQHVVAPGLVAATTVQGAIECLGRLPDPVPGHVPTVGFDADSSWLVGLDIGLVRLKDPETGYLVTVQVVFNDPDLYALRLALAGNAAKVLEGLDFQVMYRQVSPTVGVYQAEITLPDAMRRLSIGAYTVTLPVFGIAVYTNGDFQIDAGFPWNQDFGRSFTVEGIIAPGIPVVGSAGFYFGKLSSASTTRVPQADNGTFNPVVVFGFGMQVGFAASVEYGVLKAGFSVTAFGILEGVIAKWNPYALAPAGGASDQVQGDYYFWLNGSVGIIGKLWGSVDFAIVKADVDVTVELMLQLTYESYVSLTMSVIAYVDVSVSMSIDLGLFTVTIHFSFSMRLKESFTIDNSGAPPWHVPAGPDSGVLGAPVEHRLRAHRERAALRSGRLATTTPTWSNLQPLPPEQRAALTGYVMPGLSVAADEWAATPAAAGQVPVYVALLLVDAPPAPTRDTTTSTAKAAGTTPDTSFDAMCKTVLRWVLAAAQPGPVTAADVDDLVVDDVLLGHLLDTVLTGSAAVPAPIPATEISTMLAGQFAMTASAAPAGPDVAFFPVPPELRLTVGVAGEPPEYDYTFGAFNSVDGGTLDAFRRYFAQLAVQVSQEDGQVRATAAADETSVATWVYADYFLLVARQMVQALRNGLRDFLYAPTVTETPADIVAYVEQHRGASGAEPGYAVSDVFVANQAHPLTAGRSLTIGVTVEPDAPAATFTSLATGYGGTVAPADLAAANAGIPGVLLAGAVVAYPNQPPHPVASGDTLVSVAAAFGVTFADLVTRTTVLTQPGLLSGAALLVPSVGYGVRAGESFSGIASAYGAFDGIALALRNAVGAVLRAGAEVGYPPSGTAHVVVSGESLADVARALGVGLADLLAASTVLTRTDLIVPAAVLAMPAFGYVTAAGDTLASVAERYATTVATLAAQPSNAAVPDLFTRVDEHGRPAYLDLPHLGRFEVGELLGEAQRALAIQHLSGMVSRFHLHGLRLPTRPDGTSGITPLDDGMWVRTAADGARTLPAEAGLFALTGQQFALSALAGSATLAITVDASAGPDWLRFTGDEPTLTISVAAGSPDAARIAAVTAYARSTALDVDPRQLGAGEMSRRTPVTHSLRALVPWQATDAVTLPYGGPPADRQVLRIWSLPAALTESADPAGRAVAARYVPKVSRYDDATGASVVTPVGSYGWATSVTFAVRRVAPVAGTAAATTYEILGAGGTDLVLLERLLAQVGGDEALAAVAIAFAAGRTGVQTDPRATVTTGIAQVNLSTVTHPAGALLATAADDSGPPGLLNGRLEFVRLLWEASITRSGGCYLYYYDRTSGRGLPDALFDDAGQADLTLLVLHAAADGPADYANAVVTGDAFDTAGTATYVEADPPAQPVAVVAGQASLADLAYGYFSGVGDVAAANAGVPLASGVVLTVDGGVFQAPPGGIAVADLAVRYGTTAEALRTANPAWPPDSTPDTLAGGAAIWLPELTVTVDGSATAGTLSGIAGHYGVDLTALAVRNAAVPGIFAGVGEVAVPVGPRARSATVPAGVAAVGASRAVPPAVPAYTDPDYARLLLLHTFSLLGYAVAANQYFTASGNGLPAGPTTTPAPGAGAGKLRAPRLLAAGDDWDYAQAVPYPRFAIGDVARLPGVTGPSPYAGVGTILQVGFGWQDYYGNRVVTAPASAVPIVTGYTDVLVGLGAWPGVSPSWLVAAADPPATTVPGLTLDLSFDASRYQGLLVAVAASATSVVLTFTEPVDPTSASDAAKYAMGSGVAVTTVAVSAATVTLTVTALDEQETYAVSATGVRSADGTATFTGRAGFAYPDDPDARTSTVRDAARSDLGVYTRLHDQLADPHGVTYTVTTTLLAGAEGMPLDAARVTALLDWLFYGGASVARFLADRARFGTAAPAPASPHTVTVPLDAAAMNGAQVFELAVSFSIARAAGAVLGELRADPAVRSVTTAVPPAQQPLDPADPRGTLGLTAFATAFEGALSTPAYQLKVATGVDRDRVADPSAGATIWAVRLGRAAGTGISYTVPEGTQPAVFSPRPASNRLASRTHVPVREYRTGTGLSPDPDRYVDFASIDVDSWCRQLFAVVDAVLAPRYTAAAQIVGAYTGTDHLQSLLDSKAALADLVAAWMVPVYEGEQGDPGPVEEAFRQQLLVRLSDAYDTRAGIVFAAAVTADAGEAVPPALYGSVAGCAPSTVTFTSPKLALATGTDQPLAFLLLAPETLTGDDGEVLPYLTVDLTYDGTTIEHQIGPVAGIDGYLASSWLQFVTYDTPWPLGTALGSFDVPLPLRSYPALPVMADQVSGATVDMPADLAEARRWTYRFTYALPFHYPQERVYGEVSFNLTDNAPALATAGDWVPELAELVTVVPDVRRDLDEILAAIDGTTDPVRDAQQVHDAGVALASFAELVGGVVAAARGSGLTVSPTPPRLVGDPDLTFAFSVSESVVALDGGDALLVTVDGALPRGVGGVEVLVADETYACTPYGEATPASRGFVYRDRVTGAYLSARVGQAVPDRTVVVSDLDVFERQDAWAAVHLTRNEELVPDRPTAPDFVYVTPEVRFAHPALPTLTVATPFDIASIGSPDGPVTRSLRDQLAALFSALLARNTQPSLTLQAEVTYAYAINPELSPLVLPVFFLPPTAIDVQPGATGPGSLAELLDSWAAVVAGWFAEDRPVGHGTLGVDLVALSHLTQWPMPVLRLPCLRLPVDYVYPPLASA